MNIKKIIPKYQYAIRVFLVSRIAIFLLAGVFISLWPSQSHPTFLQAFSQWDGKWYLEILENGYWYKGPNIQSPVAFFPLYPLLGRVLTFFRLSPRLSLFLISNLSALGFFLVFWELTKVEFNKNTANKAVFYYAIFPLSFYFSALYSEALFMFLLVSTFYLLRKKQFVKAGIFAFLASATRNLGLLLALTVLVSWLKYKKNLIKGMVLGMFSSLGTILFFLFNLIKFNNFLAPLKIVRSAWHRQATFPWKSMRIFFEYLFVIPGSHHFFPVLIFDLLFLIAILTVLYLLFKNRWLGNAYWLFCSIYVLLILSQVWSPQFFLPTGSLSRYLMVVFPFWWGLAKLTKSNSKLEVLIEVLFPVVLGIFSLAFFHGVWIQ